MGRIANCENTRSIPSGQPIQGNGQKLHVIPATDAFCRFGKVRIGVGDFVMEMGQALPPHAVSAAFGKYISALPIVVPIDRTSVVSGTSVSVRVDLGGRRITKTKKTQPTIRP